MEDRRKFVRRAIERVVLVGVQGEPNVHTFMRDVSEGGMSLAWVPGIPVGRGRRVNLELPLGRSTSRLKTAATVCGVSREPTSDVARVHLEFADADPAFRRVIVDTLVDDPPRAA